jgi:hypothetical protein
VPSPGTTVDPNLPIGGDDWGDSAPGEVGERYLYNCPPDGDARSLWGTDIYTSDSSVCTAGVHSGLITFAQGGSVVIENRPGQESYIGSFRNGVTSSSYASWVRSFIFVSGSVPVPTPSTGPSGVPGAGYGADTMLFSDDFSDTSGGWATESGPDGTVAYESEKLAVDLAANVSYVSTSGLIDSMTWDVVRVEATLTATGGNTANYVGLLCGPSADDAAGAIVGTDGVHAFIRRTGSNYEALEFTQGVAGSHLHDDVPARLTLECAGLSTGMLRLRLSFDGELIDEYSDDAGPQDFQTVSVYVEGKAGAGFTVDDVAVFGGDAAGLPPLATGEMAELLTHVPAAFNVNCHEVTTFAAGEVIAVQCSPSPVTGYVTYTQFDTDAHAQDAWFDDLDFFGEGAEGTDCDTGPCLVAWDRAGLVEGRYFANSYTAVDPNGLIAYWFDSGLMIEAGLAVYDTTFAELYDLALQAGPVQ